MGGPPYFRSRRGCAQVEVVLGCVGFSSGREQRYFLVGLPVADADGEGRSGSISCGCTSPLWERFFDNFYLQCVSFEVQCVWLLSLQ